MCIRVTAKYYIENILQLQELPFNETVGCNYKKKIFFKKILPPYKVIRYTLCHFIFPIRFFNFFQSVALNYFADENMIPVVDYDNYFLQL